MIDASSIKEEFHRNGVSVASWARANGLNPRLVFEVLAGRRKCVRGQSHEIAVALGLKDGPVALVDDFTLSRSTE